MRTLFAGTILRFVFGGDDGEGGGAAGFADSPAGGVFAGGCYAKIKFGFFGFGVFEGKTGGGADSFGGVDTNAGTIGKFLRGRFGNFIKAVPLLH